MMTIEEEKVPVEPEEQSKVESTTEDELLAQTERWLNEGGLPSSS